MGTFRVRSAQDSLARPPLGGEPGELRKQEAVRPTSLENPRRIYFVSVRNKSSARCDKFGSLLGVCKVLSHRPSPRVSYNLSLSKEGAERGVKCSQGRQRDLLCDLGQPLALSVP